MGIPGLLKGLQFCSQKRHIRDFSNQVLAVDASSWLHKSVYSVSERYVESLDKGRLDHTCVQVATKYIVSRCQELLLHANIRHIYLTLDGKRCPLKAQTNQDRDERRQQNLADARGYKKAGRADKAQEKYKACIKISSQMANAVADEVTRRFAKNGRVTCIYSPYEADAQLVKLCMDGIANAVVTEDSDVLVYSVSCNFSFPILYKLERDTGACDVITMEWLLNPQAQPNWTVPNAAAAGTKQKSVGALESILKSLVSRQSRRSSVGARLFVQSCVLAGCDYCPSKLNGVGLVTAFKLVRDNAHRSAADRFNKVLKSLSKKARGNINLVEYEELLSKSEAVFYYHPVLDLNSKNIIPLMSLHTEEAVAETDLQITADSHPSLCRFNGDWSFLGDMTKHGLVAPANLKEGDDETVDTHVPLPEIVVKKKPSSKPVVTVYDGGVAAVSEMIKKTGQPKPNPINPYVIQKKRPRPDGREPLSTIGATTKGNHFSHKAGSRAKSSTRSIQQQQKTMVPAPYAGLSEYSTNRQDPRFVKRDFNNPKSYAKLQKDEKASKRSKSLRSSDEQQHANVDENASLRNLGRSKDTSSHEPSTQSYFVAPPRHMEQNIFAEQDATSFCYSEVDHPQVEARNSAGMFHGRHDEIYDLNHRQEVEYAESRGNEPRYEDEIDFMPYGNSDFAPDAHVKHTDLSVGQQSIRRVTLEDAASDALYKEFDAAASRSINVSSHANEYERGVEEKREQTSKYFANGANLSHSRYPLSGAHETNNPSLYHSDDTVDEFAETSFAPTFSTAIEPGPLFAIKTNNSCRENSYSNDNLSLSSCEDIGSPPSRLKTRSGFGNALSYCWAGMALQEEIQDNLISRTGVQELAPIFRQTPPSTFKTGTTPPVEPRSPLSFTSPEKRGAAINYQTRPAASLIRTNKAPPKRGLITNFFPSKSSQSPQDENEFARY